MAVDKARDQPQADFIFIKQEKGHVKVLLNEIASLEAMGDYVKMSLADGTHLVTRRTLADLEARLPADRFVRVHKSFIVNTGMVATVGPSLIVLHSGSKIPIAKSYKAAVNKRMGIG